MKNSHARTKYMKTKGLSNDANKTYMSNLKSSAKLNTRKAL